MNRIKDLQQSINQHESVSSGRIAPPKEDTVFSRIRLSEINKTNEKQHEIEDTDD